MGTETLVRRPQKQRMTASLTFLEAYEKDGASLLDRVVTGDETWVKHVTCENKKQSMEWGHTSSPKRPRKCLQTVSKKDHGDRFFWTGRVCFVVDFLERGSTTNSERFKTSVGENSVPRFCFFMTTPAHTRPIALESSWILLDGRCLIIRRTVRILRRATNCFQT